MEEMAYVACYCQHRSSRNAFNVTPLLTQPKENDTGVRYGTGPALSCAIAVRKTSPPIKSSRLKMSPGFCNCPRSQADVPSSESKPTIFARALRNADCKMFGLREDGRRGDNGTSLLQYDGVEYCNHEYCMERKVEVPELSRQKVESFCLALAQPRFA